MFNNAKEKLKLHAVIIFFISSILLFLYSLKIIVYVSFFKGLLFFAFVEYSLYYSCLILFAIAEKDDQKILVRKTKIINQPADIEQNNNNTTSNNTWICKKCGSKNDTTSTFCNECGEYR